MKVLYYSMVDWKWIKQRPHFITIHLNRAGITTDYAFPQIIGKGLMPKTDLVRNENADVIKLPVKQLPKENLFPFIKRFNELWRKKQFQQLQKKNNYDCVILTHPDMVSYLPAGRNFTLIYEMMDLYSEFSNVSDKDSYLLKESLLCSSADSIITSSVSLKHYLINQWEIAADKIRVIHNACDSESFAAVEQIQSGFNEQKKTTELMSLLGLKQKKYENSLVYIGTISAWLDIESLVRYADKHQQTAIILVGPVEVVAVADLTRLQKTGNIYLAGSVEHSSVGKIIQLGTVMLIPFRTSSLIESVDPVKMYEYIYYGKPVVSSYWPELDRFRKFAAFYDDKKPDEFAQAVSESKNKVVSNNDISGFIEANNWNARAKDYAALLASLVLK